MEATGKMFLLIVFTGMMISLVFAPVASAENKACKNVSAKCGDAYDKTIDGKLYSCKKCTQALCKKNGAGAIAGSETKTVCTSKGKPGLQGIGGLKSSPNPAPFKGTNTAPMTTFPGMKRAPGLYKKK
jgi:hypothetical protein